MTATVDQLRRDHVQVLAQLADVEHRALAAEDPSAPLSAFSSFLASEVLHHFTLEEDALFPLLGHHLSYEMGPLAVMLAEHAEFRRLQEALTDALRTGDRNTQRVHARAIIDLLRDHIAKEDDVLFPLAEEMLAPAEKAEVDQRAQALAGAAPRSGSGA